MPKLTARIKCLLVFQAVRFSSLLESTLRGRGMIQPEAQLSSFQQDLIFTSDLEESRQVNALEAFTVVLHS